jgi:hypothetical protein
MYHSQFGVRPLKHAVHQHPAAATSVAYAGFGLESGLRHGILTA